MGDKHNLSKELKNIYPGIAPMLKDTIFVDFLGRYFPKCRKNLGFNLFA
ncbi:MAG: hypothetical protein BWY08_00424 [Bacteroidetes bacterium ADurb.Bin174]|jgi:hypothetical protein|nr:MAG: hypothetical protein BWY08_00424 [Bacteroidetes bacterium ADurb.Bin174]